MNDDLLQFVHPLARYRRVPLRAEENAFGPLSEALERFVEPPDEECCPPEECTGECCDNCQSAEEEFLDAPAGAAAERIREQFEANRDAWELIDAAIDRGTCQLAEPRGFDGIDADVQLVRKLRTVFHLRAANSQRLAAQGDCEAAARELARTLRLVDMLAAADGTVVMWLALFALESLAVGAIRGLAMHLKASLATLETLLRQLGQPVAYLESLAQSLRVDFKYYDLEQIRKLPQSGTLEELVDVFLGAYYQSEPWPFDDERAMTAKRSEELCRWRMRQILALLRDHPRPFDAAETVRVASGHVAEAIESLLRPSLPAESYSIYRMLGHPPPVPPTAQQNSIYRLWPGLLLPIPLDYLNDSDSARELQATVQQAWEGLTFLEITDDSIAEARRQIAAISNPVGMLVSNNSQPGSYREFAYQRQAEREGTKAVVALRLHLLKHGRLPRKLKDLVTGGILNEVPHDPFAGAPLRYSRRRRLVWSVGKDGKDSGGVSSPNEPPALAADIVWRIA